MALYDVLQLVGSYSYVMVSYASRWRILCRGEVTAQHYSEYPLPSGWGNYGCCSRVSVRHIREEKLRSYDSECDMCTFGRGSYGRTVSKYLYNLREEKLRSYV